ncbi:MAG: hypothetical protein LZ169_03170 [Thaumarchaeota archaeon]|jgi:hypothetical protein|nr:hypothetical protein [Candidatus Wolframiiraptor allenii]
MSSDEAFSRKLATAAAMLLFRSHRKPGVKGWELKQKLGKNYVKIIDALNSYLRRIGLEVKTVLEEGEDLDKARFYIVLSHQLTLSDLVAAGWSIDEVAALAIALSILASRGGKAPLRDVLEVLEAKLPRWKAETYIERAIRRGYLEKTEDDVLVMGWRTRVEVDQQELLKTVLELRLEEPAQGEEKERDQGEE